MKPNNGQDKLQLQEIESLIACCILCTFRQVSDLRISVTSLNEECWLLKDVTPHKFDAAPIQKLKTTAFIEINLKYVLSDYTVALHMFIICFHITKKWCVGVGENLPYKSLDLRLLMKTQKHSNTNYSIMVTLTETEN